MFVIFTPQNITNEWLKEAALVAEDSFLTNNVINDRCSFLEKMNGKLREETELLKAEHKETCATNSITFENALSSQKIHIQNYCVKQIADNEKINLLTIQLDKINELHNLKKNENNDLVCAFVTQLEVYQSTIQLIKNDSWNLRSNIKQLETKLLVIQTKIIKNKKSFSETLTVICNENKTTFIKLKKIFQKNN